MTGYLSKLENDARIETRSGKIEFGFDYVVAASKPDVNPLSAMQ